MSARRPPVRRLLVGGLAMALLALGFVGTSAFAGTAARATAPPPVLNWTDCGDGLRCAQASVPLDHDDPDGRSISLAVAQLPATDPANRIGTLFVQPAGSLSGVDFLRGQGAQLFSDAVRARFDLVSFDRRGVGGSAPVRCFATGAEADAFVGGLPTFPVGADEVAALGVSYDDYAERCVSRNGDLLDHVSSTDTARDLDLLRAAVGDRKLTYVGYSWSAYVGAIYANLFPDRVRAIVYDGPQYAPDFATGRPGTNAFSRTNADLGAEEALSSFLTTCREVGPTRCAFAAGGDPATKYDVIINRLRQGALDQPLPDWPAEFSLDDGILLSVYGLFSGDTYGYLADSLQTLYQAATGTPATAAARGATAPAPAGRDGKAARGATTLSTTADEPYANGFDAFSAMACADLDRPDTVEATELGAQRREAVAPHFGRYYAWYVGQCASWPGPAQDRYTGDWLKAANTRGLVVGLRYDPIAHYGGLARFAHLIDASLLTVTDGRGHLSIGKSSCARDAVSTYLVTGKSPADTITCTADRQPF